MFLTTSLVGFIWAMVVGVQGVQDLDDWNSKHRFARLVNPRQHVLMPTVWVIDGTLKTVELVLAIMAFVVGAVELVAFGIGCTVSPSLLPSILLSF